VVTEGVAQAAVGSVEALGRLLGELDSLGDQLLVGLVDVVHRDDGRHAHRPLGHEFADLLGRPVDVRGRAGPFQQQLMVGLTREVDGQVVGGSPTMSVNVRLNVPRLVKPTSKQISVTL